MGILCGYERWVVVGVDFGVVEVVDLSMNYVFGRCV